LISQLIPLHSGRRERARSPDNGEPAEQTPPATHSADPQNYNGPPTAAACAAAAAAAAASNWRQRPAAQLSRLPFSAANKIQVATAKVGREIYSSGM